MKDNVLLSKSATKFLIAIGVVIATAWSNPVLASFNYTGSPPAVAGEQTIAPIAAQQSVDIGSPETAIATAASPPAGDTPASPLPTQEAENSAPVPLTPQPASEPPTADPAIVSAPNAETENPTPATMAPSNSDSDADTASSSNQDMDDIAPPATAAAAKKKIAKATPADDPLEPVNRVIFDVNDFLDRLLIRPLAELDRAIIPPPIRHRVADILDNMNEPVILVNNLLQGEFDNAGITAKRFAINTTLGVGGMFDWADDWNLHRQEGDFGQTLYTWGVGSGPYLILPLFGPSNLRDAAGVGVDTIISPWQYAVQAGGTSTYDTFEIVYFSADAITKREQNIELIDSLRKDSLDYYAKVRSIYNQYRSKQLGFEGMVLQPAIRP